MKTVVHIKLARVTSYKNDGMPNIERATVKLEAGDSLKKFMGHLRLGRYLKSEPPTVVKVLKRDVKDGEYTDWKEADKKPYVELLAEALTEKKEHNKANDSVESIRAENEELKERLARLEALVQKPAETTEDGAIREKIIAKANELNIQFNQAIGTAKLLARVQDIEPEFDPEEANDPLY